MKRLEIGNLEGSALSLAALLAIGGDFSILDELCGRQWMPAEEPIPSAIQERVIARAKARRARRNIKRRLDSVAGWRPRHPISVPTPAVVEPGALSRPQRRRALRQNRFADATAQFGFEPRPARRGLALRRFRPTNRKFGPRRGRVAA